MKRKNNILSEPKKYFKIIHTKFGLGVQAKTEIQEGLAIGCYYDEDSKENMIKTTIENAKKQFKVSQITWYNMPYNFQDGKDKQGIIIPRLEEHIDQLNLKKPPILYLNHQDQGKENVNVEILYNDKGNAKSIIFYTSRKIAVGEELTLNYGEYFNPKNKSPKSDILIMDSKQKIHQFKSSEEIQKLSEKNEKNSYNSNSDDEVIIMNDKKIQKLSEKNSYNSDSDDEVIIMVKKDGCSNLVKKIKTL